MHPTPQEIIERCAIVAKLGPKRGAVALLYARGWSSQKIAKERGEMLRVVRAHRTAIASALGLSAGATDADLFEYLRK